MTALEGREDVGTGTYSLYGKLRKVWTLQEAPRRTECPQGVERFVSLEAPTFVTPAKFLNSELVSRRVRNDRFPRAP